MTEREGDLLEWLSNEQGRLSALLADYEAGRRKIVRVENGRSFDETEQEINNMKQRIAQIGTLIAGF
jgi:uncharacterized protein YdcH (DUF465 family)